MYTVKHLYLTSSSRSAMCDSSAVSNLSWLFLKMWYSRIWRAYSLSKERKEASKLSSQSQVHYDYICYSYLLTYTGKALSLYLSITCLSGPRVICVAMSYLTFSLYGLNERWTSHGLCLNNVVIKKHLDVIHCWHNIGTLWHNIKFI